MYVRLYIVMCVLKGNRSGQVKRCRSQGCVRVGTNTVLGNWFGLMEAFTP